MTEEKDPFEELRSILPLTFGRGPIQTFDRSRIRTVLDILSRDEIKDNIFQKIGTSCKALDDALNGGFCVGNIVEIYGEAGTGKTQFSTQLCVNVQRPKRLGGLEAQGLFIDGESGFRPNRLREMAEGVLQDWFASEWDVNTFLDNIHVLTIKSLDAARVGICFQLESFLKDHPNVRPKMQLIVFATNYVFTNDITCFGSSDSFGCS
jgi:RecA/RadA recombinase